jgi:5'-3' exonuclease
MKNPGKIRNKIKRTEIFSKYKQQKKKSKKKLREEKVKEIEALGDEAPPKQVNNRCKLCNCDS